MACLYSNENFPLPAVEALRQLGHDVLTTQERGCGGLAVPDSDVLRFASSDQRAVLTFNRRHFARLHSSDSNHAGIIVCTFDFNFSRLAQHIDQAITPSASLDRQLIRVNRAA
jgi:hypothetical protein